MSRVRVMMALQRGPAARRDLEIAELAGESLAAVEQGLARDPGEVAAVGLVGFDRDAFPAERIGLPDMVAHGVDSTRASRSASINTSSQ